MHCTFNYIARWLAVALAWAGMIFFCFPAQAAALPEKVAVLDMTALFEKSHLAEEFQAARADWEQRHTAWQDEHRSVTGQLKQLEAEADPTLSPDDPRVTARLETIFALNDQLTALEERGQTLQRELLSLEERYGSRVDAAARRAVAELARSQGHTLVLDADWVAYHDAALDMGNHIQQAFLQYQAGEGGLEAVNDSGEQRTITDRRLAVFNPERLIADSKAAQQERASLEEWKRQAMEPLAPVKDALDHQYIQVFMLFEEATALENAPSRTPESDARLAETRTRVETLSAAFSEQLRHYRGQEARVLEEYDRRAQTFNEKINASLLEAIADVQAEYGDAALVPSQAVVYMEPGHDLTTDLIAALDRRWEGRSLQATPPHSSPARSEHLEIFSSTALGDAVLEAMTASSGEAEAQNILNDLIAGYAAENGVHLLLDADLLYYANPALDVTPRLIQTFEAKTTKAAPK